MKFQLEKFEAPTLEKALEEVRARLGRDALIVSTRTFHRGGVLGVGGQEVVEVYAADTRARIQNIKRQLELRSKSGGESSPAASALREGEAPSLPVREAPREERRRGRRSESAATFASASGEESVKGMEEHPFLAECHQELRQHDVEPRVAEYIVREISRQQLPGGYPEPARVRATVRQQLLRIFEGGPVVDDRRRPRIIVLVGPTGVGKTTTIAKLAARAKINERKRVGLITLDTFRIAAVDQLEKYAQIIGLPLVVARNPRELETAVREFRSKQADLVFIDTAGRSHRDELKMAELREFLTVLPDAEVHLVLSTTTHSKTIMSIANRFATIGFHKIILTKIDETVSFGSFVHALLSIGRPVSFISDGQNVPDDIMASDPERLVDLVLKTHAL